MHKFQYIFLYPGVFLALQGKNSSSRTETRNKYKLHLSHVRNSTCIEVHAQYSHAYISYPLPVGWVRTGGQIRSHYDHSVSALHVKPTKSKNVWLLRWGNRMGFCCTHMKQISIKHISCRPPNIRLLVTWTWIGLKLLTQRTLIWMSLIRKVVNICTCQECSTMNLKSRI